MIQITIEQKDAGQRLDKFLRKHLPQAGGSFLYKMLRKKNIVLNGNKAEGKELLAEKDAIGFFFSEETYAKFRGIATAGKDVPELGSGDTRQTRPVADPAKSQRGDRARRAYEEWPELRVLYENEHLLFIDKPAGILSQSDATGTLSLNDWVYGYALSKGLVKENDNYIPSIANRLDRNTSGIVMAALTYAGSRFLSEMIRGHRLRKYYEAVAEGRVEKDGELQGYLVKDTKTNKVRVVAADDRPADSGDMIHTRYRILSYEKGYTKLEVELITGKSHQIRAHFSSIGHPIAGDLKYGGHPYHGQHVQQLRAVRVEFPELEDDPFGMSGHCITAEGFADI